MSAAAWKKPYALSALASLGAIRPGAFFCLEGEGFPCGAPFGGHEAAPGFRPPGQRLVFQAVLSRFLAKASLFLPGASRPLNSPKSMAAGRRPEGHRGPQA